MLALSAAPSTRLPRVASARSSRSKPVRVANVAVRASKSSEVDDVTKAVAMMSLASPLLFTESASAATEMMSVAGGDGRAGLLAFPLLAALGWVGFNIAGPALNQINTMGEKKKAFVAGGMGLATLLAAQNADAATEMMSVAGGDGRAGLLAFPLLAALGWVGFNIAGPALNQINTMGEKKKAFVAGGMGLATLLAAQNADAATEMMSVAGGDGRAGLLAFPLLAALGWVGFNIAGPALNQINTMGEKKKAFVAGGMGLATLLAAQNADAATEMMSVAGGDGRAGLLAFPLLAALGWVGFNIAGPALNQINTMGEKK